MNRSKHSWFLALAILILGAATSVAQSRVQLVQGRRVVKDKVTFVVEVAHEKTQNPRYATAPEDMQKVNQQFHSLQTAWTNAL